MRQTEKHLRRIIAVLLSVVLVFSTFEGVSLTGYAAAENTGAGEDSPAEGTPAAESQTSDESITEESTPEERTTEEERSTTEERTTEESMPEERTTEESTEERSTPEEESTEEESTSEEETGEELLLNDEDTQGSEEYTGTVQEFNEGAWRELQISEDKFREWYENAKEEESGEEQGQAEGSGDEQKNFDDAIIEILKVHEDDPDKFNAVVIEYSVIEGHDAISKELWNAIAGFKGKKEVSEKNPFWAQFCYCGGENLDQNCFFVNPETTEKNVGIEVTLEIQSDAGDGVKIAFANTDFPAERLFFDTYTDTSRTNKGKYQELITAFGENGMDLSVYDSTGKNELEDAIGGYWNDEDENSAGFSLRVVESLKSNTDYILKKAIYKGDTWPDEENSRTGLNISYRDAGKEEALTEAEIEEILGYHKEGTFDEIYLEQPAGDKKVIPKGIANKLYKYLKAKTGTDSDDFRLKFGFVGDEESCTEWGLWNPEAAQESDQPVSATMTADNGKISVKIIEKPESKAKKVELSFTRNREQDQTTTENITKILGEGEGEIVFRDNEGNEIGGWYGSDERNVWLGTSEVNEMTEGMEYTVEKWVYKGYTWEDEENSRTGLDISYRTAGKEEVLTDDEIKEILGYHKGKTFDEIYLEQPAGDNNGIPKAMADELYKYLKTDSDDRRLRFGFVGADESCIEWKLRNPEAVQESDQPVSATLTATDEKISFTINKKPDSKAENIELSFSKNREQDQETTENIIKILGADECEIVFRDNKGNEIDGHYNLNERDVWFDIGAVNEMTAGTEYTVEKSFYKGDTWDWEDDDGTLHVGLNINYGAAGVDELTPGEVSEILSRREGEKFDEICFEQPKSDSNVIYKTIADELYKYLKPWNEGEERRIWFGFVNEDDESRMDWGLVNPVERQKDDQTVSAECTISDDNKVTIKADAQSLGADNIALRFVRNNDADGDTVAKLKEIFGNDDCDLILSCEGQEDTNGDFHIDTPDDEGNYNVYINVHRVDELAVDKTYTVEKRVYKGDTWEWKDDDGTNHVGLNINYGAAGVDELDLVKVREILNHRANETFDEICLEQPLKSDNNVISKGIADELYKYLKPWADEEECRIRFAFVDENNRSGMEWGLVNPAAEQTGDQTVSAELRILENNKVKIEVGAQSLKAENIELSFIRNNARDSGTVTWLKEIFGENDCGLVFLCESQNETDGNFHIGTNEDEPDDYNVGIHVHRVNELAVGREYTVEKSVYKGNTWTWQDDGEEGKEHTGLNISYHDAGKEEALTAEEIKQILSYHSSEKFDEIYLEQPLGDSNVILKEVADECYKYLKPKTEGEDHRLKFAFYNAVNESRTEWALVNPAAEQTGDQTVSAVVGISGDQVSLSVSGTSFKAERIELMVGKERTKDSDSAGLLKIFGDSDCALVFKADNEQDRYGSYRIDSDSNMLWIEPYNVETIKSDKVYSVEKDRYLGDVSEDYILISSSNRLYDQERFTKEQLQEIVDFYKSQSRSFDTVLIQQKFTDNNTIDKDLYNIARQILGDAPERRLSFGFCNCQGTDEEHLPLNWEKQKWDHENQDMEYAEFGYYYLQDDFIWSFINPTETTKDINGNVVLKTEKNKGITIQIPENRPYSAENVDFKYYCDPQTDIGKALEAALGKPEDFGSELSNDLFILNKETNTPDNQVQSYYMTNEEWGDGYGNPPYDQNYSLYVDNVREWIPGKEFWLTKMVYLRETAGSEYKLPKLPDRAQNPVWQSHDTDIAVIEGDTLKQVNNNEGFVHFSVSYSLGGETYQKAYRVYMVSKEIALERIQFDKEKLTMEHPPIGEEWEALEYLEVKYYPANATIDKDQSNLKWTTSDPKVVALKRRSDGKCEGEIKAVGKGTATIKAAYNDKIFAECVVTVEEPIVIADGAWPEPYAVTNVDKTLSDVAFLTSDDNGEWKWKEPNTSLSPYVSMEWHEFAAVYTRKSDKKTMEATVGVRMVSVAGVNIIPSSETLALTNGQSIQFNQDVVVENGDYDTDIVKKAKYNSQFDIRWSTKPANILQEITNVDGTKVQQFTAGTATGKKTITVSVVNSQTNKVIAKDSITINVTKNPVMDFTKMKVKVNGVEQEGDNQSITLDKNTKSTGVIAFSTDIADNTDYTLTAKSSDTSVIKVMADGRNQIAYELKNYGKAQLTVTANDEIRSSWNIEVSVPDQEPQIIQSQVTINKASVDKKARLTVVYADGYQADGAVTVDGKDFEFKDGYLVLKNRDLKGTVSVKVQIKYASDGGKDELAEKTVKVKLVETVPKVTLKQTKKVNTFYTNDSASHYGVLIVNADSSSVSGVQIIGSSAKFELKESGTKNSYYIILKDGETATNQPVTVGYAITDNTGTTFEVKKDLRVASENKAPALVLSAKSDTLYPRAGFSDSVLTITDKATGRPIELTSVTYNNQEITNTNTITLKKNAFDIALEDNARIHFTLHNEQNDNYTGGTDKITLGVKSSEWTKPINVSYSLKVDLNEPKLKLSSSNLTLNKNEAAGIYQSMDVTLMLAGRSTPFDGYITFGGSTNILNHVVALEDMEEGRIRVRLNVAKEDLNGLSEGKYPFTLKAQKDTWETGATTTLTVNIKDLAADKCVKVSKKGSIDVLRREQTYIAYTPKITNLAGRVIDGRITGRDANLFDAEYDAMTGQVRVRARSNEVTNYSTKVAYKVTPVFKLEAAGGYQYEVTAPEQTLKVTQGKPKITILSDYGNTLYRQAGDGNLTFGIAAELANESIAIKDVTLANYKNDLNISYNEESRTVTLSQTAMKEITKTGKTWNVKLAVRYADKAGNEKDTIVTYKVVIR